MPCNNISINFISGQKESYHHGNFFCGDFPVTGEHQEVSVWVKEDGGSTIAEW